MSRAAMSYVIVTLVVGGEGSRGERDGGGKGEGRGRRGKGRGSTRLLGVLPAARWRHKHDMNSWGDEPEKCRIEFAKLYKLSEHPDVKADIDKVRGARGPHYVYKAESLAVERSG